MSSPEGNKERDVPCDPVTYLTQGNGLLPIKLRPKNFIPGENWMDRLERAQREAVAKSTTKGITK